MPRQFSAEIIRSDGITAKIFIDGFLRRIEESTPNGIQIIIARPDNGVGWTLWPDRNMGCETPMSPEMVGKVGNPTDNLDWVLDGTGFIDGIECLRFVGYFPIDSQPQQFVEECYVDPATNMVSRCITYHQDGTPSLTVNYCSVIIGPPLPNLFEMPDGYELLKF